MSKKIVVSTENLIYITHADIQQTVYTVYSTIEFYPKVYDR